ncbi:ABC transporter ATP-binding protein [Dyadobacter sediminis]|uniref:ABC transporter ATP-binding protein n=1 Tax=Dyadobacter sediminis TaxID=1493691 RepID=A0A5R9KEN9_9BACT|nr:ABC transporter ATP-binding protein [Dyadobacter sediminis]TLU94592.1 ABC transporter ATP-binding protein [Dyadobacter sediminis]GGB89907.1 spermidine/putrescine import ATP-binding protein PotA [Dyadobacter sediminis]
MVAEKSVLKAEAVSKSFGDNLVLSGIDLELHAGEWLGILGESGSGKSTLLRIMGRFLDAEQGNIFFKGNKLKPVGGELIPGHPSIRLIHQEFELFPNQTVEENIAYSLRFYEVQYRKEKVSELIATAGLENVRNQKAKLLSGGEKQRTAIARAIAEQPDVLLLDEPFAHLDNHNRRVLANAIEVMRKKHNMACIFVTHEAADALAWSDRIAVLKDGHMVQAGTPSEIYNNPLNSYVAELTGAINWLADKKDHKACFIRPEKLKLTKYKEKSKWQGRVENIRFHGNYWEVRCENETEKLSFYRSRMDLEVGQTIFLTYSSKDLKCI